MRHIEKPDFSTGEGGWINPEFLPCTLREELLLHLAKSPLTAEQRQALIEFANDIGQMVMDGELLPVQVQRAQIERIARDAHRLLSSLNALSVPAHQALQAHTDYLAYGTTPPVALNDAVKAAIKQPNGSLLSFAWDWVDALEKSSNYAVQQFTPDTTSKPLLMRARGYVSMLAERVHAMTGVYPPKDAASWFAGFVGRLGEHLDLPVGPRVVASGIDALR
ncbi:hypothetical protein [Comamonas sp. GB3 AK4-5]|uniref:hypothetical protein n=1 Tax=Comamonas sp. GB3 AK4-5 TaxID=3231487 RepID=UPI00351F4883